MSNHYLVSQFLHCSWAGCPFGVHIPEATGSTPVTATMCKLEFKLNGNWLQIWKSDGSDGISWDELQLVKNKVFGQESWAIEIFPAESELVNMRNVRHLWLVENKDSLPNLKTILKGIGMI